MTGFVGSHARKRRRNFFLTLAFLALIVAIYFIFPTFQLNINDPIPDENLIPDPTEDLTSLASDIEELELTVFQKDQKIKFRDCLLYTSPSPRDRSLSRMPSSA